MTGHMVIYRGLPGSGKTTQAMEFANEYENDVVLGRDHLRKLVFNAYVLTPEQEKSITKIQREMIWHALKHGKIVHVDDMNLKNAYVKSLVDLAVSAGATWKILDLTNVPLELCIERQNYRSRQVPRDVIERNYNKFIKGKPYPLPFEYFTPRTIASEPYKHEDGLPWAIMVDLDGTLAHCGDRDIYDGSKAHLDTPDLAVQTNVLLVMEAGFDVLFCSGRSDDYRDVTSRWICDTLALSDQYVDEHLFMRKTGDGRKDSEMKLELFDRHIRGKYNILYVLDDRQQVVDAWRSIGLKVFQVAEGNF